LLFLPLLMLFCMPLFLSFSLLNDLSIAMCHRSTSTVTALHWDRAVPTGACSCMPMLVTPVPCTTYSQGLAVRFLPSILLFLLPRSCHFLSVPPPPPRRGPCPLLAAALKSWRVADGGGTRWDSLAVVVWMTTTTAAVTWRRRWLECVYDATLECMHGDVIPYNPHTTPHSHSP
jgi:hypothetical protein